jgi:AAA+ superfamily predicted ATPase
VFLRVLEYYEGILILTSNRVGIFDEAFKSRIQVALHYQSLTPASRRKIWQNFLDMLQNDKEDVDFQDLSNHLEELADCEMIGRDIRNALTTARQIALYKNETLSWDHIELTINTARDFTRYLGRLHGHTEEQWARQKKER